MDNVNSNVITSNGQLAAPVNVAAPKSAAGFLAEAHSKNEATIASLQTQLAELQVAFVQAQADAKAKETPKGPVTDAELSAALATLKAKGEADLKASNPRPMPDLSLSALLGIVPDFTVEQKARWQIVRDTLRAQYSAKHRELLASRRKLFDKVKRNPKALLSTVEKVRKDKTVARVGFSISEPAKPKAKKEQGKPSLPRAKVPKAANANPPAQVK